MESPILRRETAAIESRSAAAAAKTNHSNQTSNFADQQTKTKCTSFAGCSFII
jgi:hypothetical protein